MNSTEHKQQLLAAIAEAKGYRYTDKLVEKSTNTVVAVTEHETAKVLLGQMTTEIDLATVESILAVVSKLPNFDKLIETVAPMLELEGYTVPKLAKIESHQTGTPSWFRRMMDSVGF
jgi:hypothetical protein